MNLDRSMLLTFILLHEVGHIVGGNSAGEFTNGEFSQLNIDRSIAKANEEKADEFAAALVRSLIQPTKVSDASLAANWVALELTKLSWNMQAYRSLDEFGAAATGKPAVFFDQGYSHPNLAWRMLRSNYLIQQTPWQNGYCERAIGSIRRECLDHVVVVGERHLRHLLRSYATYYNQARTHLSVNKDAPSPRTVHSVGRILPTPFLGGLHHLYVRV
jgi:hypothetical protein